MPHWTYHQIDGVLEHDGQHIGTGYSGHGPGVNEPSLETTPNIGPICRGWYTRSEPFDHPTHGPVVMRLIPDAANEMFGRSGFLMHGDGTHAPGTASLGCIVQGREAREAFAKSEDKRLEVV